MNSLAMECAELEVPRMDKDELKRITKEALKEWLDERFISFGKWTVAAVAAAMLTSITYFIFWANGWRR